MCNFIFIIVAILLLSQRTGCDQSKSRCLADSPLGVVDVTVAIGPLLVLVMAQTLKVYKVDGLNFDTRTDVAFASFTDISRSVSGPTTCNVYPVMIVFFSPSGRGSQEISAEVGCPCLTLSPV